MANVLRRNTSLEEGAGDTFGVVLRRYRKDAGLTQEKLAERAQMSVRGLGDLERGVSRPYQATMRQLADALGLSLSDRAVLLATLRHWPGSGQGASRIPIPSSPLVGRERELAELLGLVTSSSSRLVTLTGPGGVGKTRLALAVAAGIHEQIPAAIHFVRLAPLHDPSLMAATIAEVLGLRGDPNRSAIDSLINFFHEQDATLLLDNLEHLTSAAPTVAELLAACADLRVIATSREALRVQGEQEYPVHTLPTPDPSIATPLETALKYPAVDLFVQRVLAVQPRFNMNEENVGTVVQICHRLDGLPLAIELAAARVKLFPAQELLSRLDRRLQILTGGPRDVPARLQSMRDAIAWSYELLDAAEQQLFRRLAVFSGGCTLEAAECVCWHSGENSLETLDGLSSLLNKSLLTVREGADDEDQPRFFMLETIKEFALEQLMAGPDADATFREHSLYYLSLAEKAEAELSGAEQYAWLDVLEREHDNFRVALQRAQATENAIVGLELSARLWPFWWARNYYDEAQKWLDAFLPRDRPTAFSPSVYARALHAAGVLKGMHGHIEPAIELLQKALVQARLAGDGCCEAATFRMLGATEQGRGRYGEAEQALFEALSIYQELDDRSGTGATLSLLAGTARYQGDFDSAVSLYREALTVAGTVKDSRRMADILARLGSVETERGRPSQSRPLYEEARAHYERMGDKAGIADIMLRWGETAWCCGELVEATVLLEESLTIFRSLGNSYAVAYVRLFQSEVALSGGDIDRAETLATENLQFFQDIGDARCVADSLLQLADVARERQMPSRALGLCRQSLEMHRSLNTRPQIARCLERMVLLHAEYGLRRQAARLHGAAEALREEMNSGVAPVDRHRNLQCLTTLRNSMGDSSFTASRAEGLRMTLSDALDYAVEAGQDIDLAATVPA